MKAGITGLPFSGKTTLFCALTGQDYEQIAHHRDIHLGTVKVPDARLEKLYEMFKPKKITYATMEYCDVAGQPAGQGKSMEPKTLQTLKNADSLIVVLDSFSDTADPKADFNTFMGEFALNDLLIASNRLERLEKDMRSGKTDVLLHEKAILDQCIEVLENGGMLRDLEFSPDDEKALRGFQFLTRKPLLIVVNISEELQLEGKAKEIEAQYSGIKNTVCAAISAEIEMEIAALEDQQERVEFLDSMGIEEPALGRLIRLSYQSLGLISFLTGGGPDEVRAWPVRKNSNAAECAGAIHSDLERGFIRAETVAFEDLMAAGSYKAARDQGLLRIEGKDYIVQDGDVLTIRFNV
ncbi:MAG: redox-regulated ATPase YchF [Candidatus Latescibacteria bacterium]|nr:redox-regulated ATPase YchF [Candidatus Latescibacterota bacterium]